MLINKPISHSKRVDDLHAEMCCEDNDVNMSTYVAEDDEIHAA